MSSNVTLTLPKPGAPPGPVPWVPVSVLGQALQPSVAPEGKLRLAQVRMGPFWSRSGPDSVTTTKAGSQDPGLAALTALLPFADAWPVPPPPQRP